MNHASFTIKEAAYYIYFSVMLFAKGIGWYEGMTVYNFCLVFATGMLLLKMAMDSYTLKEAVWITALTILGIVIWQRSDEKGPFLYILLIMGMKDIPVKRVFRLGCAVWGLAFAMQLILALTGLRTGAVMAHKKLGLGHILRWSLGYPHPNVCHISYVILIAFLLYVLPLKGKKLIRATLLCFIGNLYVFLYSVSYTGFLFATIYLAGNLYLNLRTSRTKAENIMLHALFPCCVLFSVAGPMVLRGKLFEICDKILNSRFSLSRHYMLYGNWSLLGNSQMQIREESLNYTLDCSYTYLLMYGGIVIFSLMCVGYILMIRHYIKDGRNQELAIIFGLLIAGISEPFLFNTAYKNLSAIFLGDFLFEMLQHGKCEIFRPCLLKWKDGKTEFFFPRRQDGMIRWLQAKIKEKRSLLACIGVAAALLAGGLYAVSAEMPDSIFILRQGSDRYEEIVYLDIDDLPENFNSRIVSYKDSETPMYEFRGNMLTMEYVRGIISVGLAAGAVSPGLYLTYLYYAGKKHRKQIG